ncbi:hypothetical protein [Subtercola sp. YIM 133946]|uniref:hypothetical protein n=1 Tax=Subtercola sp. YIM 133946 TaxID=3118909 RepID=UPI002F95408D
MPAGQWAVVQITLDQSLRPSTLAIKAGVLRKGDADDLKDVQVMNGSADDTAGTPYYVNYSWVLLDGSDSASPVQSISALDSVTGDTGSTLLVPSDYEKCTDRVTGQFGGKNVVNVECSVDVFAGATVPDRLVFDGDSSDWQGAEAVQLRIPAG